MTPAAAHTGGTGFPPAQGHAAPPEADPDADIQVAFGDDAAGAVGSAAGPESEDPAAAGDADGEPATPRREQ